MTFEDRARAEAERRYGAATRAGDIFVAGAPWAREQGPTKAQIEAAARAIYLNTDWDGTDEQDWPNIPDREDYYPLARAALLAARDARGGS